MIWSKTVLVWSRLEIFVVSGQNQRHQYFRGWAEKRDRPIRSSYGGVLCHISVLGRSMKTSISPEADKS